MPNVTIDDVARAAGVSMKTVSRVVNREPGVREATRDRVMAAIREMDYRPNQSARSLASNRSYLIGLLFDTDMANSSYVMGVQQGILARCRQEGYELMIHPCNYQEKQFEQELRSIVRHTRIDGLILIPPLSDLLLVGNTLRDCQIPYASIAPALPRDGHPSVKTDDHRAAFQLTEHLLQLGHRNIAFIAGNPDHGAVTQRMKGFRDAMRKAGVRLSRGSIIQGYNTFESGLSCAQGLLARKSRPTAIFAANDDMAAGAMKVAHEEGLSIPGDISIAGFDDSPVARQLWPALTTVRQPVQAMSEAAAGLLLDQLNARGVPISEVSMSTELVLRDSTGPVP